MKLVKLTIQERISESNEHYFAIVGHNGEDITTSEMYSSRQKCEQTMALFDTSNTDVQLEMTAKKEDGTLLLD